jgi:putative hemolysin
MAFTEQGVAMLSSVVNSKRAIDVNIAIMRTFVKLRQMLDSHAELAKKLATLESKYDEQLRVVFEVLNELMAAPEPKRKPIGFSVKERRARYSVRKS